jgi:MFS family permease
MEYTNGLTAEETGLAMGSFALGLYVPGGFCSYLVQRFRRNLVCVWAVAVLAVTMIVPLYLHGASVWTVCMLRVVQGAAFGLAEMVLASTLVIDASKSEQRTEANHSATWFGRFALSIGPMVGLLIISFADFFTVAMVALGCLTLTILLILSVHFPFRTPEHNVSIWCLDRFFLVQGWPLFMNLLPITIAVGLLCSLEVDAQFYGFIMIGFLLALLAQRFVFRDAELKSEIVSGLLLFGAALLIMLQSPSSVLTAPMLGLGIGLVGSRFLLFFIKLSRHCKRGTALSTFMLAWESGLAMGIDAGFIYFENSHTQLLYWAIGLVAGSLLLYLLWVHDWFVKHKNR